MENLDLILQYSPWFIPLCFLLGALYAGILYYRERHNEFRNSVRYLLAAVRFLVVSFLAFLLLAPLVKKQSHESEKPVVIFAQDFSASILQSKDSSFYKTEYLQQLNTVANEMSPDYSVDYIGFGDRIKADTNHSFDGQMTDMGAVMKYVKETYENRNLGALVIASDGIVNHGRDPIYQSRDMNFPMHTVAMGDTTQKLDVKVAAIRNNDIAYKGNRFPMEVDLKAQNTKNLTASLSIYRDDEELERQQVKITSGNWQKTLHFTFEAKEEGVREFQIQIRPLEGETNTANNSRKVYVEVLENRQRILILGRNPHPDLAAIDQAISNNPNYETEVAVLSNFQGKAHAFNLVIMHNLPDGGSRANKILSQLGSNEIPIWFVVGRETNINRLNQYGSDLNVRVRKKAFEEVNGMLNERFTLFQLPRDEKGLLPSLPPLEGPFGDYKAVDESRILAYRKIGNVVTSAPLWAFAKDSKKKYAATFGEGIWRWRVYNFLENENHEFVDQLIRKSVKYLVVKADKSRFRLESQARFAEYEKISFDAELYNESYELVNEPEVKLEIIDSKGKEYPYVMSREGESYSLNIDKLPPGSYRYRANVKLGGEQFEKKGGFVVEDINLESMNTVANHHLLYRLADEHNGQMINPRQLNEIPKILDNSDLKPVVYSVKKYVEWIQIRWFLIVIIALLSLEWLVRKLNGAF